LILFAGATVFFSLLAFVLGALGELHRIETGASVPANSIGDLF